MSPGLAAGPMRSGLQGSSAKQMPAIPPEKEGALERGQKSIESACLGLLGGLEVLEPVPQPQDVRVATRTRKAST